MQRNAFKYGCILIFALIVVAVGGTVLYFYAEGVRERAALAARWTELRKAVIIAGTPLVDHPQALSRGYDDEAARLVALHNSSKLDFENPELGKIWAQIETETGTGLLILQRIGNIDNTKPTGPEIVGKAFQNDDKASQEFWRELSDRVGKEVDKSALEEQFRHTEARLNSSIAGLQEIANGLSRKETPNALSLRYLPSWEGTYAGDEVEVQNTSGSTMQEAIVFVTVRMKDGGARVHAHYVDQWQNGSKLRAFYPYSATDYANAETGANPANVEAAVYLPSGTARARYVLTPEEWNRLAKSYCSDLTFGGNYLAAYQGADQRYPAGFQFQFQGLPTLPVRSVELRFTSITGDVHGAIWTYQPGTKLESGKAYPYRSELLDGETPSHIDYIVKFSDTDYEQDVHAY